MLYFRIAFIVFFKEIELYNELHILVNRKKQRFLGSGESSRYRQPPSCCSSTMTSTIFTIYDVIYVQRIMAFERVITCHKCAEILKVKAFRAAQRLNSHEDAERSQAKAKKSCRKRVGPKIATQGQKWQDRRKKCGSTSSQ